MCAESSSEPRCSACPIHLVHRLELSRADRQRLAIASTWRSIEDGNTHTGYSPQQAHRHIRVYHRIYGSVDARSPARSPRRRRRRSGCKDGREHTTTSTLLQKHASSNDNTLQTTTDTLLAFLPYLITSPPVHLCSPDEQG